MNTSKIEKNGKIYMLAYDQGLEHGPTDFNDINCNPNFIVRVAIESGASCIAMHYGMAKQVYTKEILSKIPLILKLNGKTKLNKKNYISAVTGAVEDAVNFGAVGIGFTINPGQDEEQVAYSQFATLRREAEKAGLITILWSYARGPEIPNQFDKDIVAYSARTAAELGADIAKVKYTGDPSTFSWAVKVAGNTKVLASGTDNFPADYLNGVKEMLSSGAAGIAVGRKVWQNVGAIELGKQLAEVVYNF